MSVAVIGSGGTAVVADADRQAGVRMADADPNAHVRPAVLDCIGQRLLDDAVGGRFAGGVERGVRVRGADDDVVDVQPGGPRGFDEPADFVQSRLRGRFRRFAFAQDADQSAGLRQGLVRGGADASEGLAASAPGWSNA